MAAASRPSALRVLSAAALASAVFALPACQLRPNVLAASSRRVGTEEIVQVSLRSADAKSIKNRQLYFSVVVGNCEDPSEGFPAEAYVSGKRASEFDFSTEGEQVVIVGRVPAKIFDKYTKPCAFLRGGGYLTGTMESAPVPVVRQQRGA